MTQGKGDEIEMISLDEILVKQKADTSKYKVAVCVTYRGCFKWNIKTKNNISFSDCSWGRLFYRWNEGYIKTIQRTVSGYNRIDFTTS